MSSEENRCASSFPNRSNVIQGIGYTGDERNKKSRKAGEVTQVLARNESCLGLKGHREDVALPEPGTEMSK